MSIHRYRTDTVGNAVDKCASGRAKLHTWVVSEPPLHNEAARAADRGMLLTLCQSAQLARMRRWAGGRL